MITIINGGTQGLGEAVARKLATDGATGLVLTGRSHERGGALARELSQKGTPTTFVLADIGDPESPAAIVEACEQRFDAVHGFAGHRRHAGTTRAKPVQGHPGSLRPDDGAGRFAGSVLPDPARCPADDCQRNRRVDRQRRA